MTHHCGCCLMVKQKNLDQKNLSLKSNGNPCMLQMKSFVELIDPGTCNHELFVSNLVFGYLARYFSCFLRFEVRMIQINVYMVLILNNY